jgi:ABC-type transport system substrate-binding protein
MQKEGGMLRKLYFLVTSCLGLFLSVFLALPPGAQAAKDSLVLAVGGENAEGYDPLLGWGSYGNPLFQSTLLRRDADLNIVPDLAQSWSLAPDRVTWTITIRPDARFSDGSPLTAKDVAFTFSKALEAGGKIDVSPLESATAVNATTVVLKLKHPDITFIQHLISLGIVPEKHYGPEYGRNPIGSGPYKLVRWDEGQQMIVEANPYYYGPKPAIGRLVFLFADEDAALAAARAGQVDVLSLPSSLARQQLPGMRLHVVKSVDNRGLMFPTVPDEGKTTPNGVPVGNTVTADVAIRKAVNYAINRKALVDGVLNGFGRPAFGVADDLPWDNPAIRFQDNDPEKAKAILEAAPLPMVLYNVPGRTGVNMAPETVARLAEFKDVVAIKEASGNLVQMTEIMELAGDKITLLSGDDTILMPVLSIGGKGVVSVVANIAPKETAQVIRLWEQGKVEEAQREFLRLFPLCQAMFYETNPIPVKTALSIMGMIQEEFRLPLCKMGENSKKKLLDQMRRFGLVP